MQLSIYNGSSPEGVAMTLTQEKPVMFFNVKFFNGMTGEVRFWLNSVERESGNGKTFNLTGTVGAFCASAYYNAQNQTGILTIACVPEDAGFKN